MEGPGIKRRDKQQRPCRLDVTNAGNDDMLGIASNQNTHLTPAQCRSSTRVGIEFGLGECTTQRRLSDLTVTAHNPSILLCHGLTVPG